MGGILEYSHILTEKASELHGLKTCDVWEPIIKLLQSYVMFKTADDCRETVIFMKRPLLFPAGLGIRHFWGEMSFLTMV